MNWLRWKLQLRGLDSLFLKSELKRVEKFPLDFILKLITRDSCEREKCCCFQNYLCINGSWRSWRIHEKIFPLISKQHDATIQLKEVTVFVSKCNNARNWYELNGKNIKMRKRFRLFIKNLFNFLAHETWILELIDC